MGSRVLIRGCRLNGGGRDDGTLVPGFAQATCPPIEIDAAPHGHWKATTFVAGLRATGIIAPMVLDGPMTGAAFRAWVRQMLVPALSPGDVVVMDNLAAHTVAVVREAVFAAGASVLHLPPCSPDLNPIEPLFAKLKAL